MLLRPTMVPAMPPTGLVVVVTKLPFTATVEEPARLPVLSVPEKLAVLGASATGPLAVPLLPFWPLAVATG